MKKITRILLACVLLLGIVAAMAACTESTSQKAVPTVTKNASVRDNGGMAVSYGNYVYFVNGYAGESVSNKFGEVVRGAICRVTLKDGVPDYTTVKTIVPKNVFGEDTTQAGIYIVNGYLYYNTPSVEKNSKREYKTEEGVLMRTKLDGSVTETVKKFDDNDVILYAGDNSKYLAYSFDNYLYAVDKSGKETILTTPTAKDPDTDKQTYVAAKFAGDYVVFTMYNYEDEANYAKDYRVFVYDLATGKKTEILSSSIYNDGTLYTTALTDIQIVSNGFILYYGKTGTDSKLGDGFYSCKFTGKTPKFDKNNETRFTFDTSTNAYTRFYTTENGTVLAFATDHIDAFNADGSHVMAGELPLRFDFKGSAESVTMTLVDLAETSDEVYAYYVYNSKFHYIKLFDKDNGADVAANENAVAFFSGKYVTTYTTFDIIDNVIYYLNDDMEDNAYYYVIPAFADITADTDIATGKILGVISKEDMMTLVAAEATEEE